MCAALVSVAAFMYHQTLLQTPSSDYKTRQHNIQKHTYTQQTTVVNNCTSASRALSTIMSVHLTFMEPVGDYCYSTGLKIQDWIVSITQPSECTHYILLSLSDNKKCIHSR